jgi:anti-sigma regulatory factor (Ser/Thr protein kinase)
VRASARLLRVALAEHLAARDVPRGVARDVLLATDEAFINAFMHGGDVEGTVDVRADVRDGRVLVTICDDGCGFDHDTVDVRSRPDPQSTHGRGLFLIHHLMDEVEVRSSTVGRGTAGPGTLVRMVRCF